MKDDVQAEGSAEAAIEQTLAILELMIRGLVDEPDRVSIKVVRGNQSVIFEVAVDPQDVRRVIGRKGRTAEAVRELMTNYGSKAGRRFLVEIMEPDRRA